MRVPQLVALLLLLLLGCAPVMTSVSLTLQHASCCSDYELDEDEEAGEPSIVQSVLVPGAKVPAAPAPVDRPKEKSE